MGVPARGPPSPLLAPLLANEHYRQIFELARLDEAIGVFADERSALVGAKV